MITLEKVEVDSYIDSLDMLCKRDSFLIEKDGTERAISQKMGKYATNAGRKERYTFMRVCS